MTQLTDAAVDDFYVYVGTRVREARIRAHVTQATLGHDVGLTRSSIANLEAGRQRIPLHLLFLIAGALGVEACDLLPRSFTEVTPPRIHLHEQLREESERAFVSGALANLPSPQTDG